MAAKKAVKGTKAKKARKVSSANEKKESLAKRRRTLRMQKAVSKLTSVEVAGTASKAMILTRTRIVLKREQIGVLPIDKNVMIKELIKAGSVEGLARRFGTTKQAIGGWFGRRGLAVQDIAQEGGDRKKEIL